MIVGTYFLYQLFSIPWLYYKKIYKFQILIHFLDRLYTIKHKYIYNNIKLNSQIIVERGTSKFVNIM